MLCAVVGVVSEADFLVKEQGVRAVHHRRLARLLGESAETQVQLEKLEATIEHTSPDEWDRVMAVNLKGLFLCVKAVYPAMKQQGKGKIINISSGTILSGSPLFLHYVSSKAGVIGFTRALAREVGADNICVNSIMPGLTISGSNQEGVTTPEQLADRRKRRCFQRDQYPQDLVGTVVFLASEDSDFMTGQSIAVDGGMNMH